MSADPLAGKRQAINDAKLFDIAWPDTGDGCPVEIGETFQLRSCAIEITRTQRVRTGGKWHWRASFTRYPKMGRPRFLAQRGGTTTNPLAAMAMQDDPDAGTLQPVPDSLGPPPESAPDHADVPDLKPSREARQRYERDMAERRVQEATAPLEERLARLREMAGRRNIDISSELRVIERRIAAAEGKVSERAAA